MVGHAQLTIDVSAALPFRAEANVLAATLHVPSNGHAPQAVLVCWPGGSYSRAYWDIQIPGRRDYSFAEHMTAHGFLVVAVDPLGVGDSSRPEEVDAVTVETMAAGGAEFIGQLRAQLRAGELGTRLVPFADVPLVGVGHSLGGCITVVTQANHDCYEAIAVLGFTHGSKDTISSVAVTGAMREEGGARAAAVAQAKAFFSDWDAGYSTAPREPNHGWLYNPDTPAEVVAADDQTLTPWPRQSYVDALTAGYSASYAARITTPVLLGFGDRDIPERPHDDVGFYTASSDVTLVVLPNSAHCHNFATTRSQLWNRLGAWAAQVPRRQT
jgi:pimeloyl-ACP methyl ester carboxylesterase